MNYYWLHVNNFFSKGSPTTCKDRLQKKQCSPQTGDRAKPANWRGSAMYL
ncbi:hypothetical protein EC96154_A0048 [Escherichia coli 96.154]|nr:hypothetical protein EC96154_A0048 [Escherichia coli 96.154]